MTLGVPAVLGAVLAFSWGFAIVKVLPLPEPAIAFWRLAFGVFFLGGAALVGRVPWPQNPRPAVFAGLCFGLHQLLFIAATKATSIAIVTLLGALQPLLVAAVSRTALGERVSRRLVVSSLVALGGVGLVVFANARHPSHSFWGDAMAFANIVLFTGYFLLTKRARLDGGATLTVTATAQLAALCLVVPVWALSSGAVPEGEMTWGLLLLLVLGPGNGHLLVNWAHTRVPAALSALMLSAVPILATLWAHLIFDEPYGIPHLIGMLVVAAAIETGRRAASQTAPAA